MLYVFRSIISVRYELRVTEMRAKFYTLVTKDSTYPKIVLPSLERRNDTPAADDLVERLEKLDTHMTTQLMKVVPPSVPEML